MAVGVLLLDPLGILLVAASQPKPPETVHSFSSSDSDSSSSSSIIDMDMEIPAKLWRYMALSDVWGSYERGLSPDLDSVISQLTALPLFRTWSTGSPMDVVRRSIRGAIDRERRNLSVVPSMVEHLQLLRSGRHPHPRRLLGLYDDDDGEEPAEAAQKWRIVCVSNMAREEMRELGRRFPEVFAVFDEVVVSGEEGVRLPSMALLRRAMERMGTRNNNNDNLKKKKKKKHVRRCCCYFAHATCMQSVIAAVSLGFRRATLDPNLPLASASTPPAALLRRTIPEASAAKAIASARNFLLTRYPTSFQFPSVTAFGVSFHDNFARFLIADLLRDSRFLPMQEAPSFGLLFFVEKTAPVVNHPKHSSKDVHLSIFDPSFILQTLPEDLDTTSIGLSILHKFGKVSMDIINRVLDKMLAEHVCDMDGILQVYFDVHRPRIDPIVITNIIYLFHLADRGHEVEKSEMFVRNVLFHKAYEGGTLYYELGEAFLLHVSRLVHAFQDHFTRTGMRALLVKRLQEHRMQTKMDKCNCLALAMYMRSCILCGLGKTEANVQRLIQLQKEDGSWCCHPYYIYGSNCKGWIGNDGLTTSYALSVLENAFT